MADQETVEVAGVSFSWWVTNGDHLVVTVGHPDYGTKSEVLNDVRPSFVARLLAKELVAAKLREKTGDTAKLPKLEIETEEHADPEHRQHEAEGFDPYDTLNQRRPHGDNSD